MRCYDRFTFAGFSVWDESVFGNYETDEVFSLARSIREMIAKGACKGLVHHGYWFDIGRPCDLIKVNCLLGH